MEQTSIFDVVRDEEPEKDDYQKAQDYFSRNWRFFDALIRGARVMERRMGKVSARGLIEFARWYRWLGNDGMYELLGCFSGVRVEGDDVAAIPNAYSAYLTRVFEAEGMNVTKARSKMDKR